MSASWSQGSQPSGPAVNNNGPFQGPPPICFHCGGPHYVIACPQQKQSAPVGLPPSGFNANQQNAYGPSGGGGAFEQRPPGNNGQNGSIVAHFPAPKAPPIVTRYAVPGGPGQYSNASGSHGQPVGAPAYQQYTNSAPPVQSYPPPNASYPNNPQQHGPSGSPPMFGQPPYSALSSIPPQGYQAPARNQYSQASGPPQYGAQGYQNTPQQFAPPPATYQPPKSYPTQIGSFSGPSPSEPPAQQETSQFPNQRNWRTASSYVASPFPHNPQFNSGYNRDHMGTPSQQSMSQSHATPYQTPQQEYGHVGYQATSQSSVSVSQSAQSTPIQALKSDPHNHPDLPMATIELGASIDSRASNRTGTPNDRPTSSSSSKCKVKTESTTPSIKLPESLDAEMDDTVQYEDGELTEEDLEALDFDWELEKIFDEQPPTENVRLAQPLSTTWESTPVPLLDPRLNNSVSRYARKDNLKDFMKPIRSQPQWSYLKEDPAFSDSKLEGPLIPLADVPAWMEARHGATLPKIARPSSSRKRARSEQEVEQNDVDNQIKMEAAGELLNDNLSNKRQKNEELEGDTIIVQTDTQSGGTGTPTLGRTGTPSFGAADDVWAPQPGEGACSAPLDPTEALLASLGVSGSPKPVRKNSISHQDDGATSYTGAQQIMSPQAHKPPIPYSMTPQVDPAYSNSPNDIPQQPFNASYSQSAHSGPPQGQFGPPHGQYANASTPQNNPPYQPYNPPRQNSYGNEMSSQGNPPYASQQYGPPRHNSFGNGISPQSNPPFANQSYALHRQNSYSKSMPQHNAPPYGNQSQVMPPQAHQPNQYGPSPPSQGNHQYFGSPQNNVPYGNGYGPPPQQYPPQHQFNGMPQTNDAYPQSNENYGNHNFNNPQNGMAQQGYPSQQPYNNNSAQGFQPPRQDSGYVSARGSYSNSSGANQGLRSQTPQQQQQNQQQQQSGAQYQQGYHGGIDGAADTPTPKNPTLPKASHTEEAEETNFFASLPSQFPRKEKPKLPKVKTDEVSGQVTEQDESPLTPTSMEILGKLIPTDGNANKPDQLTSDGLVRKVKRPQPVVAAAYSRRW